MMMEEEIERTKEEIRGIEEACEKVEQVLARVAQGGEPVISLRDSAADSTAEGALKDGGEEKMEDVQPTGPREPDSRDRIAPFSPKWYEDERLLSLWNGDSV